MLLIGIAATMEEHQLHKHILDLEQQLASPSTRGNADVLEQLIDDDFVEFGASGKRFSKTDIIKLLMEENNFPTYELADFSVRSLGDSALIATYRIPARLDTDGTLKPGSLRSSVWRLSGERWQLCFHQGTQITEK